jgi:hypothetical protein
MHIKVKGHSDLVRDTKSGAIINIASEGEIYSAARAKGRADAERLNKVEQDVSEIKDMLKQLIER